MKKLLGISLVAILAATPLMAGAAVGDPVAGTPASFGANPDETAVNTATASTAPKYQLAGSATTDNNAASAGYVKGAYNAAIKAINAVHDEVTTLDSDKQDALTASAGINIDTNDKITVDYVTTGGLELDGSGDTAKLQVNTDDSTIGKDSTTGDLKVLAGGITNTELAANAVQTGNIANNTILVEDVATTALVTAGNDNNDKLTTQGYVDTQVSGINTTLGNTYAKKTGVEQTIKNTTLSQGAVTQGFDGALASGTVLTVMTNWSDDTSSSNVTAVTGIGTLATNVSVAAPTINANSVTYAEPAAGNGGNG